MNRNHILPTYLIISTWAYRRMDVCYRSRLRVSPSGGSALREAGGNCGVADGVSTTAGVVFHDRVFRDRICVMF